MNSVSKNPPSILVIGISLAAVTLFQLPVYFLARSDHVFLGIVFNELIVMAGVPLAVIAVFNLDLRQTLKFKRIGVIALLLVIAMAISADILIDYLVALSEHFYPSPMWMEKTSERLMSVSGAPEFILKLFLLCILPAVCEEIFFRGFCQTSIAARWGAWIAIVITALLFAALHLNPWQFHIYFILGLFLGWLYFVTGTLWAPILFHFINNLWTFATHLKKIEFPVGNHFGLVDCAILGICLIIFTVLIISLRGSRPQEVDNMHPNL